MTRQEHGPPAESDPIFAVVDAMPIAASVWRSVQDDFVFVHVNEPGLELTAGQVPPRGQSILDMYPRDTKVFSDLQACAKSRARVRRSGQITMRATGAERFLVLTYGFVPPDLVIACAEDVTAERDAAAEATAELAASEAKFRRMAELSKSAIYTYAVRPSRGFEYVSPAVEDMTGFRPEEFYGKPDIFERLLHPDSAGLLEDPRQVLDRWTVVRLRHRDGRDVWTEQHLNRVRDDTGVVVALQGEARDITAQREGELALRRLAAAVETATDAIFTVDERLRVRTWNRSSEALFGHTAQEMIGTDAGALVPPEHRAELDRILACLHAGRPAWTKDRRVTAGQRLVDMAFSITPLDGAAGDYAGAVVIVRDVTAEKRRERQLTQLAAVIDSSGEAIFVLSLTGTILTWNRGAEVTYGFMACEAVGGDLRTLLNDETHTLDEALRRAAAGETVQTQACSRHRDGHWIDVAMTFSPMEGTDGAAGVSVVGRDVTEQLEASRSRERMQAQLAHAQRLEGIGQLAGGIAHDFNNLLAVLKLYGEFALEALADDHPARADVEHMRAAAQRATDLTGQLLTFSRREVVRAQRLDVGELLRDLEHLVGTMLGTDVELHLEGLGVPLPILADRSQFERVVENLASNARDAMPDGGTVTVAASAVPAADERGEEVLVTVTDTGEGMSEAVRQQIFEPFFTTKVRGEGTGLGLATVYGIVVGGGGRIEVESEQGVGTRFVLALPMAGEGEGEEDRDEQALLPADPEVGRAPRAPAGQTVIIVEDDEVVGHLAARVLRARGYGAVHLRSPREAVEVLADPSVQAELLLTDVVMPEIDGLELASRAVELRPGLPVIFMSAFPDAAQRIPSAANFIAKPFSGEKLVSEVARVLSRAAGLKA